LQLKPHAAGLVADLNQVDKCADLSLDTIIDDFELVQPTADRMRLDTMGARDALNRLRSIRKPR